MQNLIPYLMFNGDCEDASAFYKQCFDAESVLLERYMDSPISVSEKDSDKIMHSSMTFWGGTLMGSDHTAEAGYTTEASGTRIHLSLGCDTVGLLEGRNLREIMRWGKCVDGDTQYILGRPLRNDM